MCSWRYRSSEPDPIRRVIRESVALSRPNDFQLELPAFPWPQLRLSRSTIAASRPGPRLPPEPALPPRANQLLAHHTRCTYSKRVTEPPVLPTAANSGQTVSRPDLSRTRRPRFARSTRPIGGRNLSNDTRPSRAAPCVLLAVGRGAPRRAAVVVQTPREHTEIDRASEPIPGCGSEAWAAGAWLMRRTEGLRVVPRGIGLSAALPQGLVGAGPSRAGALYGAEEEVGQPTMPDPGCG